MPTSCSINLQCSNDTRRQVTVKLKFVLVVSSPPSPLLDRHRLVSNQKVSVPAKQSGPICKSSCCILSPTVPAYSSYPAMYLTTTTATHTHVYIRERLRVSRMVAMAAVVDSVIFTSHDGSDSVRERLSFVALPPKKRAHSFISPLRTEMRTLHNSSVSERKLISQRSETEPNVKRRTQRQQPASSKLAAKQQTTT